jgi:lysophospholipase L1-like esterase
MTARALPFPTQKRNWKHKLLTVAIALLIALAAAEAFCRACLATTRSIFPRGTYVVHSDPMVGYRMAPNISGVINSPFFSYTMTTNSLGLRGAEPDLSGRLQTIAVIGDSMTFGLGVSDSQTIPAFVAAGLDPEKTQVLNAGTYAYTPFQELRAYRELSRRLRIDTVIVILCENDVIDQAKPLVRRVHNGHLLADPPETAWEHFKANVISYSELAARCRFSMRQFSAARADLPLFLQASFEQLRSLEIDSTQRLLAGWIEEATTAKQRMIITYIPHKMQIEPKHAAALNRFGEAGKSVDLDAAHRWLVKFMKAQPAAEYVDLVTPLREHAHKTLEDLYLGDGHVNEAGNRIIATALLAALK